MMHESTIEFKWSDQNIMFGLAAGIPITYIVTPISILEVLLLKLIHTAAVVVTMTLDVL